MSEPSPIDESAGQVVRRRRRRIVRHVREKTPEPSSKNDPRLRHSDEDDINENSVTDETTSSSVAGNHAGERSDAVKHSGSSHRSKILSLRDRGVGPSISFRSQSSPRVADEGNNLSTDVVGDNDGLGSMLRQVKRSLSSPR